jgi:peptidoglycan-N-acetylglucosamine deacetylase
MEPEYAFLLDALVAILALDALILAGVLAAKARAKRRFAARSALLRRVNRLVLDADEAGLIRELEKSPRALAAHLKRLLEGASPGERAAAAARAAIASIDFGPFERRYLSSRFLHRRIEAYQLLDLRGGPDSQSSLLSALSREPRRLGRLVALNLIARNPSTPDVPALMACLEAGRPRDRKRELAVLEPLAIRLRAHFSRSGPPEGEAGLGLFLMTARSAPSAEDWEMLASLASSRDDAVGEEAAEILALRVPASRFLEAFLTRPERRFRVPGARLLGHWLEPEGLGTLDPWFSDPSLRGAGIAAAAEVLEHHPGSEGAFLDLIGEGGPERGAALSLAIEHRLPSLIYHSAVPIQDDLQAMMRRLLDEGRSSIFLETLASPLPAGVRAELAAFLRSELPSRRGISEFLARNLGSEDRTGLGLDLPPPERDRSRIPISLRDKAFLAAVVAVGLAVFPVAFLLWRGPMLAQLSAQEILYRFLFDLQYLFAFYTLTINGIYIALLVLSALELRSEALLWESDAARSLSGAGAMPSVSVIAPAYNEEKSIVESVHSLFSLAYPSYEVIVVNDGSSDGTLGALIAAFDLKPTVEPATPVLPCMPTRTVFRSAAVPNLTVIDKANGGKADALNSGLNLARGDYVCTIDADSILDPQALLRAMLQAIASEREAIAVGGNVFPVNGCAVEHGHLQGISVPEVPLARFQVIEYLRSFVAGRLGWASMGGLLVISGAFAILKRESVMELGGFLTGQGSFRRDTVGEDMEIVVRLTKKDGDERRGGRVVYAYNANCWTEVPEDRRALRSQRDRWHRGLLEVACMHRSMCFRPRYGAAGMVTMPYLFAFEVVGPWLETLGNAALAAILAFNLIDPIVPLTVFGIAVAFGAAISIASLLLAERQILYFRGRDFAKLLATAVIENFGLRQLLSMSRVAANVQFFFMKKGWGRQERKGFARGGAA